jgi:hypothetical protein
MLKVGIWLMVILGMAQVACAGTMSVVERKVEWVAPDSYQITLGIDPAVLSESPDAIAAWQLVCQTSENVSCSGAPPSDYIFGDGSVGMWDSATLCYKFSNNSVLGWTSDPATLSTTFYGYTGNSPQVPETGKSNLVQIVLTSPGATEPFIAFDPSGSFWLTDSGPQPFSDFPSIPEPSCIRILLSGVVVFLITMVNRRRYAHRAFSSCWRKISGFHGHV